MVRGYIAAPGPKDIVYAPINLAVTIAEGLAKKGHSVDFYGPSGTRLNANVRTRNLRALVHNDIEFHELLESVDLLTHYVPSLWDQFLTSEMFRRAQKGEYDLLYFHHPETALPYAQMFPKIPVAYTLNDPIFGWYQEIFEMFKSSNQFFISISNNQRSAAPQLQFAGTVYNGIDTGKFKFSGKPGKYLLFVGRIVPEKGVHEAIQVAKKSGEKLLIAGPVYADKHDYFDNKVQPYLDEQIQYLGLVDHDKLPNLMRQAKALLVPIKWDEPFGLTMTEAMACGTPVVAFRRGSVPEIVQHGKTGFIVDNVTEMVAALGKIDRIKRADCRKLVLAKFSDETMVDNYEATFKNILRVTRRGGLSTVSIKRSARRAVRGIGSELLKGREINLPAKAKLRSKKPRRR